MPLLQNSIGDFNFIALRGKVITPQQQIILSDRPAVDGTEKVLVGLKGQPFTLISQVDVEAYADAFGVLAAYQLLVEADVQELVKGGFNYINFTPAFSVQVLRVIGDAQSISGVSGGLNPPSFGFLEAEWTLIAVPI